MRTAAGLGFCLFFSALLNGQTATAKSSNPPDDRFKADILVVVAHPDDESLIFSYLAKAIEDEHKTVAVVFATDGAGGGNAVGSERVASLGAVRQIEARRALATFGVQNVWFLFNKDVATQDVLATLGSWDHGGSLADVVRIIRLTRPEVVLTWLPAVVAGENHGGHQAAGVIASGAFDLAGLRPWQPKTLFYFSDASFASFQIGKGRGYRVDEMSRSVGARDQQTALSILDAPPVGKPEWREVRYEATSDGKAVGSVTVRIHLLAHKGIQTFEQ